MRANYGKEYSRIRFGFLAYRDLWNKDLQFEKFDFNTDIDELTAFIDSVKTHNGVDYAEDVTGAITFATNNFSFDPQAVLCVFLIADAPTHGKLYHNLGAQGDKLYNEITEPVLETAL
jgi:hypothetical protein